MKTPLLPARLFPAKRAANLTSTMRAGGFYALSNDVRSRGNFSSSPSPGPIVHASNIRVPLARAPILSAALLRAHWNYTRWYDNA